MGADKLSAYLFDDLVELPPIGGPDGPGLFGNMATQDYKTAVAKLYPNTVRTQVDTEVFEAVLDGIFDTTVELPIFLWNGPMRRNSDQEMILLESEDVN